MEWDWQTSEFPVLAFSVRLHEEDDEMINTLVLRREALGLTVADMADSLGCSEQEVHRFEGGDCTLREIRLYKIVLRMRENGQL